MNCPRCSLVNPPTAQRCDCGYDFQTAKVEKAYFQQELPAPVKTYLGLVLISDTLALVHAAGSDNSAAVWLVLIHASLFGWLFFELVRKKNWARIALAFVTFPIGLVIGLSREAKLYCLQRD